MKKLLLALSIVSAGCSQTDSPGTDDQPDLKDKIINIQTSVKSRAPQLDETGAGNFQSGDRFYLTASGNTSQTWYTCPYTVSQSKIQWSDLHMDEKEEVTFTACYPVPEPVQDLDNFIFDATKTEDSDLLLASPTTTAWGKETVHLNFIHAMHKLVIHYVSQDGSYNESDLKNISTSCTALTTCKVDLKKAQIIRGSEKISGNYPARQGDNIHFLIVPQATREGSLHITGKNGKEFTKKLTDILKEPVDFLEGGKVLNLTLNILTEKIEVVTGEIGPWENQGSMDGEIIM